MKVYLGVIKKQDKYQYGVSIYSEKGKPIYSATTHEPLQPNKFENIVSSLNWVTTKLKNLAQNKTIDELEPITMFISSKTVYTWFERELAPEPYTVQFSDLLLEMSFIVNQVELIYSKTADKRVLFSNSYEDKPMKVTDLFG